jgi:hypothetical protein
MEQMVGQWMIQGAIHDLIEKYLQIKCLKEKTGDLQ